MRGRATTDELKRTFMNNLLCLWLQAPEQRFGQLLANAECNDLYYLEDDNLLQRLEDFVTLVKKVKKT